MQILQESFPHLLRELVALGHCHSSQQPYDSIELLDSLPNTPHFSHASKVNNCWSLQQGESYLCLSPAEKWFVSLSYTVAFFLQLFLTIKYFITQFHASAPSWMSDKWCIQWGIETCGSRFHLHQSHRCCCWSQQQYLNDIYPVKAFF